MNIKSAVHSELGAAAAAAAMFVANEKAASFSLQLTNVRLSPAWSSASAASRSRSVIRVWSRSSTRKSAAEPGVGGIVPTEGALSSALFAP